jgi:hypothetical protein
MSEPMSDRELHERVADALAALRFYRTYFSSTGVGGDRFKEIVTTLYDDGKRRNEKFGETKSSSWKWRLQSRRDMQPEMPRRCRWDLGLL